MSTATQERSYLEMSDEELMNLPAPDYEPEQEEEEEVTSEEAAEVEASAEQTADTEDADEAEEQEQEETEEVAQREAEDESEEPEEESDANTGPDEAGSESVEVAEEKQAEEPKQEASEDVDYKAAYEQLTRPFKANGREIQVKSVDDAISLMQMGANYNKKMAALKPNLKLLKMLQNNNLLSEEKISFLIDLEKKNPEAINKLVKDSGLDPMDLDAEKASAYQPKTYAVDDREIELDTILDEIQGSQAYTRTLDIVSNKWDGASKQIVANSPQLLKVINDHVERGVYDVIAEEVERERMFGRLNGLSDIEAYRQVGDAIQARGGFDHLAQQRSVQGQQAPVKTAVVAPKPKQAEDDKLKERRRAASSTKPVAPKSDNQDFNPLALSDEEFSKIGLNQFL